MPIQTIDRGTAGNTGDTFKVGAAFDTCQANDEYLDLVKAPLSSPAFTDTPTAPTAPANTSTAQIATTAFVQGELADRVQVVETFADLATTAATTAGMIVYLKQHTSGGLGGGHFQDMSGAVTNDGGTLTNNTVTAGRHWKRINYGRVTVDMYGAVPSAIGAGTPVVDCSPMFALALASNNEVHVITKGTYRLDTMITVESGKTLLLSAGVELRRYASASAATTPVFWLRGTAAGLIGAGKAANTIKTENKSPHGVVRIGHQDMTVSHATVTYCQLRGVEILGSMVGGQTSGDPDKAVYIPNAELGGIPSYFHSLFDLRVGAVNFGIHLHGYANGNTMGDIHGIQIGNLASGNNAFIYNNGALDNIFDGAFFHSSEDSIGLLVDDYDNRAVSGGVLHESYANSYTGIVCEQGGGSAIGLKALSGGASHYEIIDNTAGGNVLYAGFNVSNLLTSINGLNVLTCGSGSQLNKTGTGTFTVKINFVTALTGAAWRNALCNLVFAGIEAGGGNEQYAKYRVPILGSANYAIGTPVNEAGSALTITQTASTPASVTFTVAGASVAQHSTLMVSVAGFGTARIE